MISFIDQLEDFSLPPKQKKEVEEIVTSSEQQEEIPTKEPEPVDTTVHIEPETLETLKKQMFEDGYQKGKEDTHTILLPQMTESLEEVFAFLEKEETYRRSVIEKFAQEIMKSVLTTIKDHISEKEFIQRDFMQDILSFTEDCMTACEGDIVISCSEQDQAMLEGAFSEKKGVIIKSNPGCKSGCIGIKSSRNEVTLDHSAWLDKVGERIVLAINNMMQHGSHSVGQESR